MRKAIEHGLDLVEVAAAADPPVCRIMDFDKYRYELSKKQKEAKKKQTVVETKEIKFRPKTEEHDLNFKIKQIKKFLSIDQFNRGDPIPAGFPLGVRREGARRQDDSLVSTPLHGASKVADMG